MTTNQPTQPDMFEPPEKFGNYLADKCLAAFNQPVDASSLARIARCAQFPDALFYQNLNNPQAARRLVNHWLDNYNALTPDDIALAQALAGGA